MTAPAHPVSLVCFHCGEARQLVTHGPPRFAFELAEWAAQVGMKGFVDAARSRVLVFCNADHAQQAMTKDGRFRLRPKKTTAPSPGDRP